MAQETIDGFKKTNITTAGSTIVSTNPGYLQLITINDGLAKTITLQDATVSAGATAFATIDAPGKGTLWYDCFLSAGLVVSAVSASNFTVTYR